ncbi:zinc finger protein 83-like [Sabethes cyaneus]|uniref:zinc finger protein 83-like n=1 Tax=Sabethes cyaneus TaxID=53552 RepID=UPI00237ED74D|nr:zinc finger protein 83-like [Sabethes cyaneus]
MSAFNLSTFPEVCRLCLQSKHPDELISVDTRRPLYNATLADLLEELTFKIPEQAVQYFPAEVCLMCVEVFEFFCKYKQKVQQIHRFLLAFVEVKLGNTEQLVQLFEEDGESLEVLFKDLDICNRDQLRVEDMLEEYSQYKIASLPTVDVKAEFTGGGEEEEEEQDDHGLNVEIIESHKIDQNFKLDDRFLEKVHSFQSDSIAVTLIDIKAEPVTAVPILQNKLPSISEEKIISNSDDEDGYFENAPLEVVTDDEQVEIMLMNDDRKLKNDSVTKRPAKETFLGCDKCSYKTRFQEALKAHHRRHQQNDRLEGIHCPHPSCLKVFPDQHEFDEHLKEGVHKQHVCDICGATLKHKYSLEVHLARHAGKPQFQCQYCSFPFYTKTEMRNHILSIHSTGKCCACTKCGAVFKNNKLLKQHLESHVEQRNFKCDTCDFAFKTVHHLRRHITTVHQEVRFHCERCEMSYGRKDKLRMHMERKHNVQSYFYCDICLRSFNSNSALEEHKGHHAEPKPLECGVCLIAFDDGPSFEQHLCISYREDYVCCGRDFKFHVHYNRHMLKEHGVQSNVRVKPKSGQLIGQMRASRRQRLTRCRKCAQTFQSIAERKKHSAECKNAAKSANPASTVMSVKSEGSMQVCEMGEEEYLVEDENEMQMDSEYVISEEI